MISLETHWQLAIFLIVSLAFFSLLGLALKHSSLYKKQPETIDNLIDRINAWWVMIIVLIICFTLGRSVTILLFFFVSFIALREVLNVVNSRRNDYYVLFTAFYILLPVQYILVAVYSISLFSLFLPVFSFFLIAILTCFTQDTKQFFARISEFHFSIMIAVFAISHVPALLNIEIENFDRNFDLMIFLLAVVQFSDIMQYIFGKLLGKHKIAPNLSPSKTVEGLIGGIFSAMVLAGLLYQLTPFTVIQTVIIGFGIGVMGFFGGLVMSAIKRDYGIKDWGTVIKGHGGMMDRVDSVSFAAPFFYYLVFYMS
ncbi:phosphatidate cytidylyltransferase [Neisseriaceae bacterium PsAf]|nr:phosphatidate cytidylyltransferase [Neisseriaceae bacterium PsAf]